MPNIDSPAAGSDLEKLERSVREIAEDWSHEPILEGRERLISANEAHEILRLARFTVEMAEAATNDDLGWQDKGGACYVVAREGGW